MKPKPIPPVDSPEFLHYLRTLPKEEQARLWAETHPADTHDTALDAASESGELAERHPDGIHRGLLKGAVPGRRRR